MSNIFYNRIHCLFLLFVATAFILPACRKDTSGAPPAISSVRNYAASPNDTIYQSLEARGQWVVITGQNLQNALEIKFNGVPATFNTALFAPNSAVVQIPAILFSTIDTSKLYTIEYTTVAGTTTFAFKLGPGAPVIMAISNVFANPGDSVFLYGTDLVLVQSLSYAGTTIPSFVSDLYGTSLGFLMPAQTPTDQVLLTTKGGSVAFKIVATPTISGVSNENAPEGDSVYVYGTYLKSIQSFSFAGTAITSYVSSSDGSSVGFKMPSISASGPVSIITSFGTATTTFNVNDFTTGMLGNFEWGDKFGYAWWGGASLSVCDPGSTGGWMFYDAAFPCNSGMFLSLIRSPFASGAGSPNDDAVRLSEAQVIPTANLADPVSNWALKFEVCIPVDWQGASLNIKFSSSNNIARWEPWQISPGTTAPVKTKGWATVTIPFSAFRAPDPALGEGKGATIKNFTDLLGASGKTETAIYIKNYGTATTATGFKAAFDNVRVVRIK
ncbi:MAG: glycan-binding surface protein [Ferruginibacter sp.]